MRKITEEELNNIKKSNYVRQFYVSRKSSRAFNLIINEKREYEFLESNFAKQRVALPKSNSQILPFEISDLELFNSYKLKKIRRADAHVNTTWGCRGIEELYPEQLQFKIEEVSSFPDEISLHQLKQLIKVSEIKLVSPSFFFVTQNNIFDLSIQPILKKYKYKKIEKFIRIDNEEEAFKILRSLNVKIELEDSRSYKKYCDEYKLNISL